MQQHDNGNGASNGNPRLRWIPEDQVEEPPGILRMRAALERGEHGDPDAELMARHRLLFPETAERLQHKASNHNPER